MNILHIANIENNPCNGVSVVVPRHIIAQSRYANVFFYNAKGIAINGLDEYQLQGEIDVLALKNIIPNIDLVIFHEAYCKKYIKIARQLCLNKIKYIIVPHSQLTQAALHRKRIKKTIANKLFFNDFFKNASGIQCLSKLELETTDYNSKKFIGTNGMSMPILDKRCVAQDIKKIVYIGRLETYQKGLDLLLNAIMTEQELLRSREVKLDIYGPNYKGRQTKILNIIQKNNIEDIVHLHSEITGKNKTRILLSSDLFIQTSRFEGMPMGILEALSYGVPCLITKGTTLGDMLQKFDAGWVADNEVADISRCIREAINSKNVLQKKSDNAIKMVNEKFAWDYIEKETLLIYKKIKQSNN